MKKDTIVNSMYWLVVVTLFTGCFIESTGLSGTSSEDEIKNGNETDIGCGDPTLCDTNATCTDTDGGFTCTCSSGYDLQSDNSCTVTLTSDPALLIHLPFDESPGTMTAVNMGTTGTANNANLGDGDFVTGQLGNALSLPGTAGVEAGPSTIAGNNERTTALWVKTTSTDRRTLFSMGTQVTNGKWDFELVDGRPEVGIEGARTNSASSVLTPINDGVWHHVAAVLPPLGTTLSDIIFYVDGVAYSDLSNGTTTINTVSHGAFRIGACANALSCNLITGLLDDMAIWNRALGPIEIAALVNLAKTVELQYDTTQVGLLLNAFNNQQNITISGRTWTYQSTGLDGNDGDVFVDHPKIQVYLGGRSGMTTSY